MTGLFAYSTLYIVRMSYMVVILIVQVSPNIQLVTFCLIFQPFLLSISDRGYNGFCFEVNVVVKNVLFLGLVKLSLTSILLQTCYILNE